MDILGTTTHGPPSEHGVPDAMVTCADEVLAAQNRPFHTWRQLAQMLMELMPSWGLKMT